MNEDTIVLPVPRKPAKASEFLQYFQSELGKSKGSRSTGRREPDGTFVERVVTQVVSAVSDEQVPTTWVLIWDKKGSLSSITVEALPESPLWWKDAAHALYERALASAFSADKERFLRQDEYAYIGPNLDGEYWIDGWRIAPALPEDENDFLSERIVFLDHWVQAVDHLQSITVGQVIADRIMVLLSVFVGVGFYRVPMVKKWVMTGKNSSKRFQLGFLTGAPYPTVMPEKGKECPLGKSIQVNRRDPRFTAFSVEGLRLPNDVRKLFRAFKRLTQADREVFFGAAALCHIGLTVGRGFPSVRLSYEVAAVEALTSPDKRPSEGFVELVREYSPQISSEFLDDLYGGVRSAHFHAGRFPLGEYEPLPIGPIMDPMHLSRVGLQMDAEQVLRPTLIDWLLERARL